MKNKLHFLHAEFVFIDEYGVIYKAKAEGSGYFKKWLLNSDVETTTATSQISITAAKRLLTKQCLLKKPKTKP